MILISVLFISFFFSYILIRQGHQISQKSLKYVFPLENKPYNMRIAFLKFFAKIKEIYPTGY